MKSNGVTKKRKRNDFMFLVGHVKFSWLYIILAVIATVAASTVSSKVPDATAQLFDGNFEMSRLWSVVGMALLTTAITLIAAVFSLLAESKSVLSSRNSVWEYMLTTRSEYYDSHDPASLLSLVTVDAENLGRGLVQITTTIPKLLSMVFLSMAMIMGYNKRLMMVFLIVIPMHLIYMFVVGRWQQRIGKDLSIQVGNLSGYLAERIRNLSMIKAFSAEKKEDANGIEASGKLYKVNKRYAWLNVVLGSYTTFSGAVSTVVTVLWGCYLLRRGEIDVPSFIGFNMYMGIINTTIVFVSILWTFLKDFQGRAFRMARLVESPREDDAANKDNTDIPMGDVKVQKLSFAYKADGSKALSDIDFTIPQGKVTAIVGPSGSGKTTLIKLFERLYVPTEGKITVGGTDIQSLNLKAWRQKLAYVVQDASVFSGTLREALTYGSQVAADDTRLLDTIDQVGLTDFIKELPQGLDTVLGSWGGSLSGGQRQRIVIARALLQNADILIFDEPTSALDPESAGIISEMILNKFKGKTVIIISHELNYIANADHIVVINQGRQEGSGAHVSLMKSCGIYRELVKEQSYQEVFGA